MTRTPRPHHPASRAGRASLFPLLLALAAALPDSQAQTIPNPSFEANTPFATAPGDVSANSAITGWIANPANHIGLNPAGGQNDFADNGAIPNGTRVAFIQSSGGTSTLSSTITGLVAGTSYRIQFRANSRDGSDPPVPNYRLNGGAPVSFGADPPVGASNAYYTISGIFTATATTAALEISNTTATDSALLVDNFTISAATAIQVTNANNDGPGSLRQALIAAAATPAFNIITFAPALSGKTITLLSKISINDAGGVMIDASALSAGITISGGDATQILSVGSGSLLSLRKLTIAGGAGEIFNPGGIFNQGTLSLAQCTLSDNFGSGNGGAIMNLGSLDLTQCTLSGNHSGGYGGAIYNYDYCALALTQCTLSGNHAVLDAGAIYNNNGTLALTHCTISQNSAIGVCQGVTLNDSGTAIIANCIIAGHSAGDYDLLDLGGVLTYVGANVIVDIYNGGSPSGPPPIPTSPVLDVLASNGGPTQTMALLPGSSARNAAVGSTITTDQRGKPRVGTADIGAFEVQSGGTFVFTQMGYAVNEAFGPAVVTVKRTGGFDGIASVKIASTNGSATALDFNPISGAGQMLNFADGEVSKDVIIAITDDNLVEANETFSVTLSAPSAGAALGAPASATVTIRDDDSAPDAIAPSLPPIITSPAANTVFNLNSGGTITVTGTATDDKGVGSVEFRDISGNVLTYAMLNAPYAPSTAWSATLAPVAGTQTIQVRTFDLGGNASPIASRTFKVLRPLTVQIAGNGLVTPAGFTPDSFREVGKTFLITATPVSTPAPGNIFKNWSLHGTDVQNGGGPFTPQRIGVAASALEKPTLTFSFREGLVLRANLVPNPYALGANSAAPGLGTNSAGVSGVEYCGLIHADPLSPGPNGTAPTNGTEGLLKASVMSTGAFSASLFIDGMELKLAGAFDHDGKARFGTSRATTITVARPNKPSLVVDLQIDLDPMRTKDTISGTVIARSFQQSMDQAVSNVKADRAFYDGLTPATTVPAAYLGKANATQNYTVVFPSRPPYQTATATLRGVFQDLGVSGGAPGVQISFVDPAPVGLTAGEVYTLVDPHDGGIYFHLADSHGDPAPITDDGDFTVVLDPFTHQIENLGLTTQDYPQGDGYGFLTITKAGTVTLTAGKLADGSGWTTTSTKLSKENKFPLFLQLYNKRGYLSGDAALDSTQPGSDLGAANRNLDWLRPFDSTEHYYAYGWEEVIRVGFLGAGYAVSFTPASSVLRRANGNPLLDADALNGNAGLSFFDGQLTEELSRTVNITTANAVTNVPANDTSFTLTLTPGTGLFKGTFVHENDDGAPNPLKTAYEGVIYQKGIDAGGYGFFLTRKPNPIDYTGESGAVNLDGFEP